MTFDEKRIETMLLRIDQIKHKLDQVIRDLKK